MRGKLLIFSAPSGSGKSTIVNWLMKEHPELKMSFSISATSRPPRCNNGVMERDGVEYYFLTPEEFRQKIKAGEFLEYEEVYHDRFYGTLQQQVDNQLAEGQHVVCDVDVLGALNIKRHYGEQALSLFIQPPSIDTLRQRLIARGTDSMETIEQRIARAEFELSFATQFDRIIVNDELEKAVSETYQAISMFIGHPTPQETER